jgi:RNA-directed DNA polymerase
MGTTETQVMTNTKLDRIAWLSKRDPDKEYDCLMHLFNQESLTERFKLLGKKKAVGIDGIDKAEYEKNLEKNIQGLVKDMKNMAYRPGPVREVRIPKEGKRGEFRSIGVGNLEDKLVQSMMKEVLESIYEPLFLECSFGFRPRRGCLDALKALHKHLYETHVQTIIDVDLKDFFGSIDHPLLEDLLKEKIKDVKFQRYISRLLKAGVLTEGELKVSEEGVVQGSPCSPILSNIFAHFVIDKWMEETVLPRCRGLVRMFRYADDIVICCQHDVDAQRIKKALQGRLERFKLQLNEEKTKLVSFDKRLAAKGIEQGTFDFLGFTFYLEKSRKGELIPKLRTRAKTMTAKLKKVAKWIKQVRNRAPMTEIWMLFISKLKGHIAYFGVSFNMERLSAFICHAVRIMFKWLNRRSQRKSFNWDEFNAFMRRFPLPKAHVVHKLF